MSAPVSSATPPVLQRVLVLHGFFQSAVSSRAKTAALRKVLKNVATIDYVQAPHEITNEDDFKGKPADILPETHYAWWKFKNDMQQYTGWEASVTRLREHVVTNGPYDAYLGFSQGASFLALVAAVAHLQVASASTPSLAQSKSGQQRLDYLGGVDCRWFLSGSSAPPKLIFASGFVPRIPSMKQLFPRPLAFDPAANETNAAFADPTLEVADTFEYDDDIPLITLPSLHVFGAADVDVPPRESLTLSRVFLGSVAASHPGGHMIPSNAEWGRRYKQFLLPQ